MVGNPRRPARVRVADEKLAAEVRAVAGPEVEVRVAPTPEIDGFLEEMAKWMAERDDEGSEASYLGVDRVSPGVVAVFFEAAAGLYETAPWKSLDDDEVLRIDIPRLEVEGACVSIIGALGESFGFVVFPDLEAFESFLAVPIKDQPEGKLDLGSSSLCLLFEPREKLSASMRREIKKHRWSVAGPTAYPVIQHRDRDCIIRPIATRDYEIATACASALTVFWQHNRAGIEAEDGEPVSASIRDPRAVQPDVRVTLPYEAYDLFEDEPERPVTERTQPAVRRAKVGRNDPCPCGSGEKYKKCHLEADERAASEPQPAAWHEVDALLVYRMQQYAERRFGNRWKRARRDFEDPEASRQLFIPWSVYRFEIDGRPIVDWYLEERKGDLLRDEHAWLMVQRGSWLSVWEVLEVESGRNVTVRDLLCGVERRILEVSGSRTLVQRDAFLGRVVDQAEGSVICGAHPRTLPPFEAAEVVKAARRRLRLRGEVPLEKLREEAIGRFLIARWEKAVGQLDRLHRIPPQIQNTDGEDLVLVEDRFDVAPGKRAAVAAGLESMPDVVADEDRSYRVVRAGNAKHRDWDSTLTGTLRFKGRVLVAETNSRERADALRRRIESACGDLVRFASRKETAPVELFARPGRPRPGRERRSPRPAAEIPPAEAAALTRQFKERHYAGWMDDPLPALDGKTPRQAARLSRGREKLDLLLREMENFEARLPEDERYDFGRIRRDLGL